MILAKIDSIMSLAKINSFKSQHTWQDAALHLLDVFHVDTKITELHKRMIFHAIFWQFDWKKNICYLEILLRNNS